jgi:PAS domain S-box-containing protein
MASMDRDRSLLFAALALQTGMIDAEQFFAACWVCTEQPDKALDKVLTERGWIQTADRPHLEYLVKRYLHEHNNDAKAAMTHLLMAAKRSLAGLERLAPVGTIAFSLSALDSSQEGGGDTAMAAGTRYAFESIHAAGGMGRVWRARDRQLDREVAIKELRPEAAGNSKTTARFVREARLTGQLEHPGIVPVYELTTRPGSNEPFYTMRFVGGGTLTAAIRSYHAKRRSGQAGPLELVALLTAFVAVCNTIAYAHSRRVLHRDLKGDNVILGDFGEVIVLDWGLAKRMDQPDEEEPDISWAAQQSQDAGLTVQGEIIGTPAYMAPEQAEGRLEQIDERTDVYGLGAMLYEILTGQPPFVGANTLEVLKNAMRGQPASPRELWADVPPALEEICLKAMARAPADRYARADEIAHTIQQWQEVQRRRAEDALRRQSEVLRSILNSMSEGVLVSDKTGNVLHINPAAERMIGYIQGATSDGPQTANEFYKPDQATRFEPHDLPLAQAIRGQELNDVEMFIRPAGEGQGIWASANARPLRDEAGALRGGVVVFRDITERKRAEEELARGRERLELAVRGSNDGLWDWYPTTGEIYYSPRWKSIIGYEDHEIAPRIEEWEQRLHPDDRERVLDANKAHIDGLTPHYECEYRLRHKDGSYRWILARGVALRDDSGKTYRVAGSHVDITERKQAEEERARALLREQEVLANTPEPVKGRKE